MGLFDELYRELFEDEGALSPYILLQGIDNKTIEVNRALWDLSRKALTSKAVSSLLAENASTDVVAALENVGELASTPGAVPDAIVVISVPAFPAESCSVMDTGSAPESDLSVFPSTTVYVMV